MSKILLAGAKYREIFDPYCLCNNITPLYIPDNPNIDPRLSGHADLNVFPADNKKLVLASYLKDTEIASELKKTGCEIIFDKTVQQPVYPMDCSLNAVKCVDWLIYSPRATSETVLASCNADIHTIPVNQGYIRCSVCALRRDAVITADRGIASVLSRENIHVLEIKPGFVDLPGYDYGFIGGASFMPDDNTVVFTGTLKGHPDEERIRSFIQSFGMNCYEMNKDKLLDTGSAFIVDI